MNQTEIIRLNNRFVSHAARSLYIFEIRPSADVSLAYRADYNRMRQALTVLGRDGHPVYAPTPSDITACIEELAGIGMLLPAGDSVREHEDYHGLTFVLPLVREAAMVSDAEELEQVYRMHENWTPSDGFRASARMAMLIDVSYSREELAEFRAYWSARGDTRLTSARWDQKFVSYLKRRHSISSDQVPVYRERIGFQRR